MMRNSISPAWKALRALGAAALLFSSTPGQAASGPAIAASPQGVQVDYNGAPALRYELQKPKDSPGNSPSAGYFHPLTTPSGLVVTDVAPDDHRHHRGVFLAWLEVRNKTEAGDFWGWGEHAPIAERSIVHRQTGQSRAAGATADFTVQNEWQAAGKTLLEETLRASAAFRPEARLYDLAYEFKVKEETTLGRHAFSGFAVRLRKDFPLTCFDPAGKVALPAPSHLKPESDWPDRPWYAFEMELADGKKAGVAVLSHPKNPPTVWHNVTGIALINPCIIAPGPVRITADAPLRLRYQVVAFDGPAPAALLNQMAADLAKTPVSGGKRQ